MDQEKSSLNIREKLLQSLYDMVNNDELCDEMQKAFSNLDEFVTGILPGGDVDERMDAILSIDTTKGNRVINLNGIAISNTIKEGYILEVSNDLMDIMTRVTGKLPAIFPCAQQDITPYGNDLHHLNSILQPAVATNAPVVGVAITTEQAVAGCATGASHPLDVEVAARFAVEVAKDYGAGKVSFYNEKEFAHLIDLYGTMNQFQTFGK